jgi:hypothetical protein
VTEGEFKALAAAQNGLLCVGLSGVWGWKTRGADGNSQAVPDLDLIEMRGRGVTIVFDSDVVLNTKVMQARHALGKELYRRGASAVYAIDLPATDGVKVGLDDFLVTRGRAAFLDLDAVELPPTDIPPFIDPISTLLNAPEEALEFGIFGIQPIGANGWRIASPKTCKSWDMLEEGYCLAAAQPLFGRFAVPKKRRVLIIEEEDPRRRLKRRLERVIHAHGGIAPSDEFLRYSVKKGFRLDDPKWREVLEYELKGFLPEFCYLDVFSRLHAQDQNDGKAMADIVLFLDTLNREYGTAFIILHHTRKNPQKNDAYDEIMGSRVLGGFADATMFFAKTKEKGVVRVSVSLKDEPEDGSFEPEFLLRLKDTEDGRGTLFEYLGAPADKRAESDLRNKLIAELDSSGDWRTVRQIAEALNITKPTARSNLNTLVDLKLAEKEPRGNAFVYRAKTSEKSESEDIFQ